MTAEVRAKLFKIDEHHSTLGTAEETGSGLGLIMCQELVHMNDGEIEVESVVGEGSVFTVLLPAGR